MQIRSYKYSIMYKEKVTYYSCKSVITWTMKNFNCTSMHSNWNVNILKPTLYNYTSVSYYNGHWICENKWKNVNKFSARKHTVIVYYLSYIILY